MEDKIRIVDGREFGHYRTDNLVLLAYAADIGVYALAVYSVFCMHADNKTGESWPATRTIAKLLGISKTTVVAAIETLEKHELITTRGKRGRGMSYVVRKLTETVPADGTLMVKTKRPVDNSKKMTTTVPSGERTVPSHGTLLYQQVVHNYTHEQDLITNKKHFSQNGERNTNIKALDELKRDLIKKKVIK